MEMMLLRRKFIISDKPFAEDQPKAKVPFISVGISNLSACSGFHDIGIYINQHMKTVMAHAGSTRRSSKDKLHEKESFIKTD